MVAHFGFAVANRYRKMKSRCISTAMLFLGGVLLIAVLGCDQPPSKNEIRNADVGKDDPNVALAWFDTLSYPDTTSCKFVKVATGAWHKSGNAPPENRYLLAFLLKDSGETFTVFTIRLANETFKKTPGNTPEHQRVGYEEVDLKKGADDYLKSLKKSPDASDYGYFLSERRPDGVELFVLAHACLKRGYVEQGMKLLEEARKRFEEFSRRAQPQSIHQNLIDQIAELLLYKDVNAFSDPHISRKELLTRFERIVKQFPESDRGLDAEEYKRFGWQTGRHNTLAKSYVDLLRTMVSEDEEHARRPVKPDREMTTKERVAELIFRLRDQNGHQFAQPGHCDIFMTTGANGDNEDSPAHQLVKIGYEAVPQLIDALEDERFTRSVGFHRNYCFSHHVLRVGDCAEAILHRISGRLFWEGRSTNAGMIKDKQVAETKKKIQKWWAEFLNKGEKQMLVDATQVGDFDSIRQAQMLLERYPDKALDALANGIAASKDPYYRGQLLRIVGEMKGEAATAILRRELKSPALMVRVLAARGLQAQGNDEGVRAMIDDWLNHPAGWNDELGFIDLVSFLAESNRPDAIRALAKDLGKRPLGERLAVIESAWHCVDNDKHRVPPTVADARDELLVSALDDVEKRVGMAGSWGDKFVSDPRMCDMAGHFLSRLWKQPDTFDLEGTLQTRDRQRIELQNIWRKKKGLEPLPVPK